jgi:hypothetical protein
VNEGGLGCPGLVHVLAAAKEKGEKRTRVLLLQRTARNKGLEQ